jgi:hypothetical protein
MIPLLVIILIFAILDFILSLMTYLSTKSLIKSVNSDKKLIASPMLNHVIELRAAQRTISSGIFIAGTVLAFLGYNAIGNIEKNVSQSVTDQIQRASRVNLDSLQDKVQSIQSLSVIAKKDAQQLHDYQASGAQILNKLKTSPYHLYVIRNLRVKGKAETFYYKDLTTIDGIQVPFFTRPPTYLSSHTDFEGNEFIGGIDVKVSKDNVIINSPEGAIVDLWLFGE